MTIWGTLGTIEFELARSPSSVRLSQSSNYSEFARIEGKPTLQKVGDRLAEVSLDFVFDDYFCNPTEEEQKLEDLRFQGEILPLIVGDRVYGDFVIDSFESNGKRWVEQNGIYQLATSEVSIRLKEWVGLPAEKPAKKEESSDGINGGSSGFSKKQ